MKILVACLGNICRSPMAEGWLRHHIAADPALHGRVEVASAGIGAWHIGKPPDPRAIAKAAEHGVDIGHQRARQLQREDAWRFDLLLFADEETLQDGRRVLGAGGAERTDLYLSWAGVAGDPELDDPYYGSAAGFEAVWQRIAEGGQGILERLRQGA